MPKMGLLLLSVMQWMLMNSATLFSNNPIIPVITINHLENVNPLADILLEMGMHTIEITLRTSIAFEAIQRLKQQYPDLRVGAGTIKTPNCITQAIDSGADFLVSPGLTHALVTMAKQHSAPFIPGVATTSEVMQAMEYGFHDLKFFPAELSGGIAMLKNWRSLFPNTKFIPTGGINQENHSAYWALDNVTAIGGSWIAPPETIDNHHWHVIKDNIAKALENRDRL